MDTYHNIMKKLPEDLVLLINSFVDPETDYIRTQIKKIKVNPNGWAIGRNSIYRDFDTYDIKNIILAMSQINNIIEPAKQYKLGSYGSKHVLSHYRQNKVSNGYINNGSFIVAMILLGYKYKNPTSLNLEFKAKYKKKYQHAIRCNQWELLV